MTDAGHVLLADDEAAFQRHGASFLRAQGHTVTLAGDAAEAVARFHETHPDIVLLDLAMPPHLSAEAGLDLIPTFSPAPVVVLTGHADHAVALRAAELGAWDFLAKPAEPEMLAFVVTRAVRKARLDAELRSLRTQETADDLGLVGQSPAMVHLRETIRRLAPARVPVVILW